MLSHTSSLLFLLLATISSVLGAVPSLLMRRAVTTDNPTGVHILYEVNWYNPTAGKFGASITFSETAPAATPTVFSIKFYFGAQDTAITDYWGDWKIVHYQSGAFHLQPGTPPTGAANNTRTYQFNGSYTVSATTNSTSAQPAAMSLLHGPNYDDRETAFQRDDIDTPVVAAGLPTEPFGAFIRDSPKAPSPAGGPATGASASDQKDGQSSTLNSNLPIIIGAIGGIVIIGAAIAVFIAVRRHKSDSRSKYANLGSPAAGVSRKGSHGHVGRDAVMPHVEHTREMAVVASDAPQYAAPVESNYYDENGYAVTEPSHEDQMAFVEQYAPQPGYHYAEVDEVEGDDYNLHQHMVSAAQIAKESNDGYYHAGEYGQANAPPNGQPNGDFFFAQDMDRSETSQAVAIDHAYVTQAIGYHQAQIEQRIQQDMLEHGAPSPMLTLTQADGAASEELYLQEEDYHAYEADSYTAEPVSRKDSGAKRAPGKNYI